MYRACKLANDGRDFFSPKKRWFRMGNDFRALVEPLDIANWYKAGNHEKGSGHYWGKDLPVKDILAIDHWLSEGIPG